MTLYFIIKGAIISIENLYFQVLFRILSEEYFIRNTLLRDYSYVFLSNLTSRTSSSKMTLYFIIKGAIISIENLYFQVLFRILFRILYSKILYCEIIAMFFYQT